MPGVEPAVHAVDLIKTLLQQILSRALAAVAVIAHHHHWRVVVMFLHKGAERIVRQVERAGGMAHGETLRIANIHQHRLLLLQLLMGFFHINTFKLIHGALFRCADSGGYAGPTS